MWTTDRAGHPREDSARGAFDDEVGVAAQLLGGTGERALDAADGRPHAFGDLCLCEVVAVTQDHRGALTVGKVLDRTSNHVGQVAAPGGIVHPLLGDLVGGVDVETPTSPLGDLG